MYIHWHNTFLSVLYREYPEIANDLSLIKEMRATENNDYIKFIVTMADPLIGYKVWSDALQQEMPPNLNVMLTRIFLLCCENYYNKWLTYAKENSDEKDGEDDNDENENKDLKVM